MLCGGLINLLKDGAWGNLWVFTQICIPCRYWLDWEGKNLILSLDKHCKGPEDNTIESRPPIGIYLSYQGDSKKLDL